MVVKKTVLFIPNSVILRNALQKSIIVWMKKIIVLYHADCPDGFGAAWAARKKFKNKAEYIAIGPREFPKNSPAHGWRNKEIYILDNSFSAAVLKKFIKDGNNVTVIDHHITAKNDVKSASQYVFNIKHSGAVLAWKHFFPKSAVPKLLLYIEGVDLWQFKLPHIHKISAAVEMARFDFSAWDRMAKAMQNPSERKKLVEEGKIILRYQHVLIKRIMKRAGMVKFQGYKTFALNSPILRSELGHELVKKKPPISIVWRAENGKIRVSLRSNGKVDVSKIAEKFPGGGGHRAAAGFTVPKNRELPWKLLKKNAN